MTALERATSLLSEGLAEQALRVAQNGLSLEPQNEALLCEVAAASAYALAEHALAERFWRRAIALGPETASMHQSLGILLASTGREPEAVSHFRRASELAPQFAEAFYCLGRCLVAGERSVEAEACLRKSLTLDPGLAPAHFCLGLLLFKSGRSEEAESCYRRAIALDAEMGEAFNNLGDILSRSGRESEAEGCYRRAIALDRSNADARFNLGNLLSARRDFDEAERCYRQVLNVNPGFADCYLSLSILLSQTERHDEAEACILQAIALNSSYPKAYEILGELLYERGRFGDAEAALRKAVALQPEYARLLPQIICAANYQCSWTRSREDLRQLQELYCKGGPVRCTPHALLAIEGVSALQQKATSRASAEEFWMVGIERGRAVHADPGPPHSRLRIGYLSANFHSHAVAVAIAGVLGAHDRNAVDVYGYSYGPQLDGEERERVRQSCVSFRDLRSVSDGAAANAIAGDGIDILVDLAGYTGGCRPLISALRPAPVIVNWLGHAGTLGHERLADYIIGDPLVTPLAHAGHFSESLALMPHCYLPYDRSRVVGGRPDPRDAGLPEGKFVFCSFHQAYKLNSQVFDIWCRLLRAVPHAVLWLQSPGDEAAGNLRREAGARRVDADRLIFARRVKSVADYLGRLQLADLALDTHPYTAHSTGADLLWAGVPLVTRIGETFASRVAASLLHAAGLPELVTQNWDDYFERARRLALDRDLLASVRGKLAQARQTAPLFDTTRFARDLEDLYREMWRHRVMGESGPIVLAPERKINLSRSLQGGQS